MFVSHKDLNGRHMTTDFCRRGAERKWRRLAEEEARTEANMAITAYGIPLTLVTPFKYLGRIITAKDKD